MSRILLRGDTSANWATANPVLLAREMGVETDTSRIKIGNGTTAWNLLDYAASPEQGGIGTADLANYSVTVTKLEASGPGTGKPAPTATTVLWGDGTWRPIPASGSALLPPRKVTISGPVLLSDANVQAIEAEAPATAIELRLPMTREAAFSLTEPPSLEIVRSGNADVTVIPTIGTNASPSPMQRIVSASGFKARAQYSVFGARKRVITPPSRPTTGLRALLVGDSLSNAGAADGSAVASWSESSGSSLALPPATQATAANQPTVRYNSANGHTAVRFDGSSDSLSLTGSWLNLFRLRSNAMVFIVTHAVTATTGDRTLLAFSSGSGATATRVALFNRDNSAASMLVGGRRTDADASPQFVSAGVTTYPDCTVLGGLFTWSAATVAGSKNGVTANTSTAFQTAGSTSDTPSLVANIGCTVGGTGFYLGDILEIAVYDLNTTVATGYQAFAQAQYGEEWLISGDTVV